MSAIGLENKAGCRRRRDKADGLIKGGQSPPGRVKRKRELSGSLAACRRFEALAVFSERAENGQRQKRGLERDLGREREGE